MSHQEHNTVRAAYIYKAQHIIERTKMVQWWADYLDCFQSLSNISDEYDLGFYWITKSGCYSLKDLDNLINDFDYERYGHHITLERSSTFYSDHYILLYR